MKIPVYWKSELSDVDSVINGIQKGKVCVGCKSPGGRNIYVVEYGEPNEFHRTANYSSAVGAQDLKCYADKSNDTYRPCIFLIGCVHGGEFEGTVALLNLIQLLETGKDFRGVKNKNLSKLSEKANLIIIPCANPDGRARVPFKSVVGMGHEKFRFYDQGAWINGSLCDWPACKSVHPIKDHVSYLGGYFNDNGINLMHDTFFDPMAEETKLILSIASEYAPDFIVNLHGAADMGNGFYEVDLAPPTIRKKLFKFEEDLENVFHKNGWKYIVIDHGDCFPSYGFNLTAALYLCCGGFSITWESYQGTTKDLNEVNQIDLDNTNTHDSIYESHLTLFEEVYKFTQKVCSGRKK